MPWAAKSLGRWVIGSSDELSNILLRLVCPMPQVSPTNTKVQILRLKIDVELYPRVLQKSKKWMSHYLLRSTTSTVGLLGKNMVNYAGFDVQASTTVSNSRVWCEQDGILPCLL